jgi:hypothetical protein
MFWIVSFIVIFAAFCALSTRFLTFGFRQRFFGHPWNRPYLILIPSFMPSLSSLITRAPIGKPDRAMLLVFTLSDTASMRRINLRSIYVPVQYFQEAFSLISNSSVYLSFILYDFPVPQTGFDSTLYTPFQCEVPTQSLAWRVKMTWRHCYYGVRPFSPMEPVDLYNLVGMTTEVCSTEDIRVR